MSLISLGRPRRRWRQSGSRGSLLSPRAPSDRAAVRVDLLSFPFLPLRSPASMAASVAAPMALPDRMAEIAAAEAHLNRELR